MQKKRKKHSPGSEGIPMTDEHSTAYNYSSMREVLGGEKIIPKEIIDDADLISLAREGIKLASVESVSKHLALPMGKMSELLHTTHRNFQRKKKSDTLNTYISGQTIEIARIITKGIEIFGTGKELNEWLNAPLLSLGDQPPLNFLDTTFGTQLILKELGKLQYGVYS